MHEPDPITAAALASGEPHFRQIGVGPWAQEHPDELRLDDPSSPLYVPGRFDAHLIEEGDRRDVLDRYRYWTVSANRDDMDARGRNSFEVAIENWTHDFNIGSIVRSANAFEASAVHIVGHKKWNRRGSLMTELYQHIDQWPTIADLVSNIRTNRPGMRIIALDNVPGSVPIERYRFPENCLLVFGAEGPGLTKKALELADDVVYISQFGSVRSINAGAAAAVAMHCWIEQHGHISAGQSSPASPASPASSAGSVSAR
jgi:tRNA(Leu) C34 or U34 (ribose-2'-O)-methylase TrmL